MDTGIDFSQVPNNYMMCLHRECVQATTCLRQLAERMAPAQLPRWTIVSPKYLASQEGACPYYRPAVKIRLAKGFTGMLGNLLYKQMQPVVSELQLLFGRRTYFRVRKGERLLSPAEQQQVLQILHKYGISHPPEFDAYLEVYDW